MSSAIVIGAGPGGLFTGAILATEGVEVTVLEKNHNIGGTMQSFKRFGEVFDTGMHVVGGLTKGGNVRAICNYLGIGDSLPIRDVDPEMTDRLHIIEDGNCYNMACGKENFKQRLISYFPEEEQGIKEYVDAIFKMADSVEVYNLRESRTIQFGEDFLIPANVFIEKYVTNPKLRSVLAYMNSFYSGVKDTTPAYIHALLQVLYINGPSRFIGGSSKFAALLEGVIKKNGGRIISGSPVTKISTMEQKVVSVTLANDKTFSADHYISALDSNILIGLLDRPNVFPKAYRSRLDSIPYTYSAFSVFLKLKPKSMVYMNYTGIISRSYSTIWQFSGNDNSWPQGLIYTTPPESMDDRWTEKMIVTCPMKWSAVERWENTKVGDRGPEYRNWKETCTNKILDLLEGVFPDIRNNIEAINTASPLTIRDYYMTRQGSMSGFLRDCNHIERTILPVETKLTNLFLTGQNNNLHGFCGVALTSMLTCEAVLKTNNLINKISKYRNL